MSVISYNSQIGEGLYSIQFETNEFDEFKKIEDEIRKLIDKRVTVRLLKEAKENDKEDRIHHNPEYRYD